MTAPLPATDPQARWGRALALLGQARDARQRMKYDPVPTERDRGTQDYVTAVDALVAELDHLGETGVLTTVTEYLAVVYGRP